MHTRRDNEAHIHFFLAITYYTKRTKPERERISSFLGRMFYYLFSVGYNL